LKKVEEQNVRIQALELRSTELESQSSLQKIRNDALEQVQAEQKAKIEFVQQANT
jgi:uncharacterized coiled-coil protein SlyX